MAPLSEREISKLLELFKLSIESCAENTRKITALERAVKAHPAIEALYQQELSSLKHPDNYETLHKALRDVEQALRGRPF